MVLESILTSVAFWSAECSERGHHRLFYVNVETVGRAIWQIITSLAKTLLTFLMVVLAIPWNIVPWDMYHDDVTHEMSSILTHQLMTPSSGVHKTAVCKTAFWKLPLYCVCLQLVTLKRSLLQNTNFSDRSSTIAEDFSLQIFICIDNVNMYS